MTRVIILNGPPRSGKDTAYRGLKNAYPLMFERIKFATPLKEACHILLGNEYSEDEFENEKDVASDYFFGVSPREFYIELAEHIKDKYTKEFFGYIFLRRYRWGGCETFTPQPIVIISDCGFKEELQPLIRFFGLNEMALIRIHRQGKDFSNDSRGYIENVLPREYDIFNPEGNTKKFVADITSIVTKEIVHEQFKI